MPLTNEQEENNPWPRYREIDRKSSFVKAEVCQGQLTELFEKDNAGSSRNLNGIPTSNRLCINVLGS